MSEKNLPKCSVFIEKPIFFHLDRILTAFPILNNNQGAEILRMSQAKMMGPFQANWMKCFLFPHGPSGILKFILIKKSGPPDKQGLLTGFDPQL